MKIKIISLQKLLKPEAVSNKEQINDFFFSFLWLRWGSAEVFSPAVQWNRNCVKMAGPVGQSGEC